MNGAPPVDPTHSLEGYCIDLIAMIAERAHFEYSIKLADDYGKKHDNGTWTGMIGELVRGVRRLTVHGQTCRALWLHHSRCCLAWPIVITKMSISPSMRLTCIQSKLLTAYVCRWLWIWSKPVFS